MHQTSTGTRKKKKIQQLLRSGRIVPGNGVFFAFLGACAVPLTSQNIEQNFQQLLRSGPIVPGNVVFLSLFGACAGLVHLVVVV